MLIALKLSLAAEPAVRRGIQAPPRIARAQGHGHVKAADSSNV
jgi:hypothetical protein